MKCVPKVLGMIKEKKDGKNIYIVVKKYPIVTFNNLCTCTFLPLFSA